MKYESKIGNTHVTLTHAPAARIVVWVNHDTHQVRVRLFGRDRQEALDPHWCDPIGAAYSRWREMTDDQRVLLMLETAIDLAMQGFDLGDVLRAFAEVSEFRALATASLPMHRALTLALTGKCLEPVDPFSNPIDALVAMVRRREEMESKAGAIPE
jgi:hypothetical protein